MGRNWLSVAGKAIPTVALVTVAIYALFGIAPLFENQTSSFNQADASTLAKTDTLPTPVDLMAALSHDGYWMFPNVLWSIRESKVSAEQFPGFWQQVAERAMQNSAHDEEKTFDGLLPAFRDHGAKQLIFGDAAVYRLDLGSTSLGLVTRCADKNQRVIGGALLVNNKSLASKSYELITTGTSATLESPNKSQIMGCRVSKILATRCNAIGDVVAEIAKTSPNDTDSISPVLDVTSGDFAKSLAEHPVSQRVFRDRDCYEWRMNRAEFGLRLIVVASALSRQE